MQRSKTIAVTTIGIIACLVGLRLFISRQENLSVPVKHEAPEDRKDLALINRPTIAPSGTLKFKLTRLPLPQAELVGINDRGDMLFLTNPNQREYRLVRGSQSAPIKAYEPDMRCYLLSSGSTIQFSALSTYSGASSLIYPFDPDAGMPKLFSDGTVATIYRDAKFTKAKDGQILVSAGRLGVSPIRTTSTYTVIRERHEAVKTVDAAKQGKTQLYRGPGSREYIDYRKLEAVLFETQYPPVVMAIDADDHAWIVEKAWNRHGGHDYLRKLSNDGSEVVALPDSYFQVERVVCGKGGVAATFSNPMTRLPARSYVRRDGKWMELPIPEGYDISFVQKVFDDGSILGFVMTVGKQNLREVLWKGVSVGILSEDPSWPKNAQISVVTRANGRGQFCVRNITDPTTGASEFYMLQVENIGKN